MQGDRLRILTFVPFYLPGYKAGGALRTVANIVDRLGDDFEFSIVTSDRDFDDEQPYSGIKINQWQKFDKANVHYTSSDSTHLIGLRRIIEAHPHDIVYLNGFFNRFTRIYLILRKFGLVRPRPVVIAPRGEFSAGALALKGLKKAVYISVTKAVGMYRNLTWQASSTIEAEHINRVFPQVRIYVAPDIIGLSKQQEYQSRQKTPGYLKVVFLSRIDRMKNLMYALEVLKGVRGSVDFDIIGPKDDRNYWQECNKCIDELPGNVKVRYLGPVEHQNVLSVFSSYHLFFLPTLGENFGHVIVEALSAGCLVLISNNTPWQDLATLNVGWDLPLDDVSAFQAAIQSVIDMSQTEFLERSLAAFEYGKRQLMDKTILEANRALFLSAV